MDATPLYDLSPLVRLMFMGVAVALLPLAWLVWRHRHAARPQKLRALTVLTLFLTFDLVLFGAFTRLTDSGLGCPDWPGCYGHASPLGARESITSAQEALPTGPVTHGKAWIEMIHRYLATGVGVLIIASVVLSVLWRDRPGSAASRLSDDGGDVRISPGLPLLILIWVLAQGAFGALTVTMKLFPAIVTLHLLGGVGLLALLAVQAARFHGVVQASEPTSRAGGVSAAQLSPGLRSLLWLTTALVLVQIALGGWVSTNYAVLACQDFPRCRGAWWPEMDLAQGFTLWRPLGHTPEGAPITFAALTAIHYVHRLSAYLVLAAVLALAWVLWRAGRLGWVPRALALLALWQLLTGLSNVVLGWPLVAAVAHTGGAAAMLAVLAWSLSLSGLARGAQTQPSFPSSRRVPA
jgi:cytochrome c oxidase assembly protein subunit 15